MSANQSHPDQFWATAPGKVILSGEHAVVYGQAALAAAINLASKATLSRQPKSCSKPVIHMHMPATGWHYDAPVDELIALANDVQQRHKDFLAGQLALTDVLQAPEQLLPASIGYCWRKYNLQANHDLSIELTTDLLLGGGMGSSASLVAVIMAALLCACEQPFTQSQLYQLVLATEQWQHGRSSGLDPHVCVFGGLQLYQSGEYQKIHRVPLANMYLVSTGSPQTTTGECVEAVRQQARSHAFWQQFGELTGALQGAIEQADMPSIGQLIRSNHRLLQSLGVVPDVVSEFILAAEKLHGAGKICGAGSIAGDRGGLVLLSGLAAQQVADICAPRGFAYWPLTWQSQGVDYGTG